mgnify:FL=1
MNIKRILLSLSMLLAATTGLIAQTTDEKGNDLDSVYAQKLLKPGTTAPDFILPMPNGYRVQLAEFKGKYVLLDFWASWCPDCRKDIPTVKAMYEKYGKNVVFIGVSFDTDRDRWAKCVADNGMTWRQVSELKRMREAKIAQTYGVQWIPSMTLVGPDGKVVLSTVVLERMEKALENL